MKLAVTLALGGVLVGCGNELGPIVENSVEWKWSFIGRDCPGDIDHVSVIVARQFLQDNVLQQEDVVSSQTPCTSDMKPLVLPDFNAASTMWITIADFVTSNGKIYSQHVKTFNTFPNVPVANVFETAIAADHGYVELTTVFVDAVTRAPLGSCPHMLMSAIDGTILTTRTPHTCDPVVLPGVPDGGHRVYVAAFDGPSTHPDMRFGSVDADVDVAAGEVTRLVVELPE